MRLKLLVCGEAVILDASSNRASCINIFDGLVSPQFPIVIPQLAVLAAFDRDDGDLPEQNCELAIFLEDTELVRGPVLVNFQDLRLTRAIVTMHGLVIPQTGRLRVILNLDGGEIGNWIVEVTQSQQELG